MVRFCPIGRGNQDGFNAVRPNRKACQDVLSLVKKSTTIGARDFNAKEVSRMAKILNGKGLV